METLFGEYVSGLANFVCLKRAHKTPKLIADWKCVASRDGKNKWLRIDGFGIL